MDTESPRINEELLHALIEKADPRLMGMVGMQALHVLALQMPTEKFHTFIEGAVRRSVELGSKANLQPQPDQSAAAAPPAQGQGGS
jgi:hypothetical protein